MSSYQTTAISKFNMKNIFANNVEKSNGMTNTTNSPTNSSVLHKPSTPLPIFRDRINHKSQLIFPAIEKSSSQSSLIFSAPAREQEYEKEALKDWLIGKQDLTVDSFIKKPSTGMKNNSNSQSSSLIQVALRRQIRPSKFQTITCPDTTDSFDSIPGISTSKPQNKQGNQSSIGDSQFIDPANNQQTKSSQVQKNYITGSGSLQVIRFSAAEEASNSGKNEDTIEVKKIIRRRNNLRNPSIIIDESAKKLLRRPSIERTKQDESTLDTVVQPSKHNRRPSIELQVEGELDISPLKKSRRNVQPSSCSDIQQFLGHSSNDLDKESPQRNRQLYYYRKSTYKNDKTASNTKLTNSSINENNTMLPSINLSNHRIIMDAQNKDSPANSNGSNYNSPMNGNNNNSLVNFINNKPFNLTKSNFAMNNNSFQLLNSSFQRESPKLPFGSDSRIPLPQNSSKQHLSQFEQYKQLQLSPFSQFPEYTKSQGMSSNLADVSYDEVNSSQDISLNKQLMHSRRANRHLQAASVGGTATNISLSDQDFFRNSQSPKSILKASASKSRFFSSTNKKLVAFNERVTQYDI